MKTLDEFKMIHAGKTACIIGSGDSLLDHIHKIPSGSITFCINTRPLRKEIFKPEQIHYLVYGDHNEVERTVPYLGKVIRCSFPTYLSSNAEFKQNDLALDNKIFAGGFSSAMAVSLAHYMGCCPIILFGMDCYRGRAYFDSDEHHTCQDMSLKDHLNAWLRLSNSVNRRFIESKEFPIPMIYTVHPPLDLIFKSWNVPFFPSVDQLF
jgi:hypothetical protein